MKVIDQLYDKIPTTVIDELTAEQCASLSTKHLDYGSLANRIIVSNNHKNTSVIQSPYPSCQASAPELPLGMTEILYQSKGSLKVQLIPVRG